MKKPHPGYTISFVCTTLRSWCQTTFILELRFVNREEDEEQTCIQIRLKSPQLLPCQVLWATGQLRPTYPLASGDDLAKSRLEIFAKLQMWAWRWDVRKPERFFFFFFNQGQHTETSAKQNMSKQKELIQQLFVCLGLRQSAGTAKPLADQCCVPKQPRETWKVNEIQEGLVDFSIYFILGLK